jgi:hypothetical protein
MHVPCQLAFPFSNNHLCARTRDQVSPAGDNPALLERQAIERKIYFGCRSRPTVRRTARKTGPKARKFKRKREGYLP